MTMTKRVLLAVAAFLALSLPASAANMIGNCEVTGEKGSIPIANPAKAGQLTVEVSLPAPIWWNGDTPENIKDGMEYCMAAEIAWRAGYDKLEVINVGWDALIAGQTEGFDLVLSTPIGSEGNVYTGKVVAYCGSYSDSIEVQVLSSAQGDNPIAKFIGEELVLLGYSINKGIFIVAVFVITAAASSYKTKKVRLDVAAVIAIIAAVFLIL